MNQFSLFSFILILFIQMMQILKERAVSAINIKRNHDDTVASKSITSMSNPWFLKSSKSNTNSNTATTTTITNCSNSSRSSSSSGNNNNSNNNNSNNNGIINDDDSKTNNKNNNSINTNNNKKTSNNNTKNSGNKAAVSNTNDEVFFNLSPTQENSKFYLDRLFFNANFVVLLIHFYSFNCSYSNK